MTKNSNPNILLVYTGGTIGMMKDFDTGALKAFEFDKLRERIPELSHLDCEIATISFDTPIDSSNMNPQYWWQLLKLLRKTMGITMALLSCMEAIQ